MKKYHKRINVTDMDNNSSRHTLHSPAMGRRKFLYKGEAMAVGLGLDPEGLRSGGVGPSASAAQIDVSLNVEEHGFLLTEI